MVGGYVTKGLAFLIAYVFTPYELEQRERATRTDSKKDGGFVGE